MDSKLFAACLLVSTISLVSPAGHAQIDDAADLYTQQQQEKGELRDMKQEMDSIRNNMNQALQDMQKVGAAVQARKQTKEFQLQCKESGWEIMPGTQIPAMTYNGKLPGPEICVQEGEHVRITLHNQLKTSTSLYFHGLILPQSVAGLPRKGAGLVAPGESYTFEFIASNPGTFWYHPQVTHADQLSRGLCGALIVEPRSMPKTYERDFALILGEWNVVDRPDNKEMKSAAAYGTAGSYPLFLANGKSAPAIPPFEVHNGERIRLRVINASKQFCPLSLTGHKFEIVSNNGSDATEPHTTRDTVTIGPGERMDLEFVADNPGVWSLSSMIPSQSSANGKFPGGLAVVVRYPEAMK